MTKDLVIDPEFVVDSRCSSQEESDAEAKKLMIARKKQLKSLTKEQIEQAKQLQQKFQEEDQKK